MPRTRSKTMVAKEAVVITVGARPPEYEKTWTINRRTGERVEILKDDPIDPGDEGMPYAFKEGQKVPASHPAVQACPGAFVPDEEEVAV